MDCQCGCISPDGAKFCRRCGSPLASPPRNIATLVLGALCGVLVLLCIAIIARSPTTTITHQVTIAPPEIVSLPEIESQPIETPTTPVFATPIQTPVVAVITTPPTKPAIPSIPSRYELVVKATGPADRTRRLNVRVIADGDVRDMAILLYGGATTTREWRAASLSLTLANETEGVITATLIRNGRVVATTDVADDPAHLGDR